ncbi:MAG TPA: aspartate--ammonia ligase [Bacteroidales bacterium]|nr:aspartate--ammonia ligase [Bacteroidales bacterium]
MKTNTPPEGYKSILSLKETEQAIKLIKDQFQHQLSCSLKLSRVTAPIFVEAGTGINDDLNGIEKPVSFNVPGIGNKKMEIVQSLAKWKRMMLAILEIGPGKGLYTDMNAIRPDEILSNIHSIYVDQWDWEKRIRKEERTIDYLKKTVKVIYDSLRRLEFMVCETYNGINEVLPEEITFIHSEDLQKEYPGHTPPERENMATEKYGAIFIIGIGSELKDGRAHDGRAPDYDDWSTPTLNDYKGLNGDIIFWNPVLKRAFEISSMGIRVDSESLIRQLKLTGTEERMNLLFHSQLLKGDLPYSIGGGIGQSRICMFMLRKAHIGEVQASVWPESMKSECISKNIYLI